MMAVVARMVVLVVVSVIITSVVVVGVIVVVIVGTDRSDIANVVVSRLQNGSVPRSGLEQGHGGRRRRRSSGVSGSSSSWSRRGSHRMSGLLGGAIVTIVAAVVVVDIPIITAIPITVTAASTGIDILVMTIIVDERVILLKAASPDGRDGGSRSPNEARDGRVASRGINVAICIVIVIDVTCSGKVQFVGRRSGLVLLGGHSGQVGSRRAVLRHDRRGRGSLASVASVSSVSSVSSIARRHRIRIRHHLLLTGDPLDHPRSDGFARRGRRSDRLGRLAMGWLVGHSARGGHFDDAFFSSAAEIHFWNVSSDLCYALPALLCFRLRCHCSHDSSPSSSRL